MNKKFEVGQRLYFCRDYEVIECVVEKILSNSVIVSYEKNEKTVVSFKRLHLDEDSALKVIEKLQEELLEKERKELELLSKKEKPSKPKIPKVFDSPIFDSPKEKPKEKPRKPKNYDSPIFDSPVFK